MSFITKVTTKGQITLPANVRKQLSIDKDNYLAVDVIGDYIIMKKVALRLKEISDVVRKTAEGKSISKKDIEKVIAESRTEVWEK